MKKIFLLVITFLFASCAIKKVPKTEQVAKYFEGFKKSDYQEIEKVLSDTLIVTEGDYVTKFTPESYYEHFKWDSVFKPNYKIIELQTQEDYVSATASVKSLKFEYLKNNPMICERKFYFKKGKISKIEIGDCPKTNWTIWSEQVDKLVNWIKLNQPELDGFIYDLSQKGALNYLKAIDLYKKENLE